MAERFVNGYKRLFEVRLLHHYWLDEGATLFDALTDAAKKDKRLLTYDVRPLLAVVPTATTGQRMKGLRCVFKITALGFVVAVPEDELIPDDTVFEFVLTVQHSDFFNYTSLALRPQKIHEIYHPPEDKTYRYKENVPIFSNLTGTARGTDLYLSTEMRPLSAHDQVEALVLSGPLLAGSALLQLTSDQPSPTTHQLNAVAADLPVFFHQADLPEIISPAGLAGTPQKGIELTDDLPAELFGLIRIAAVHGSDAQFSCTTGQVAQAKGPVFQIRFKNRSTLWKYFDKQTGAPGTATPVLLPLTYFGNAGTKQKPSEGLVKAAFDDNSAPTKVTSLVSEIFI